MDETTNLTWLETLLVMEVRTAMQAAIVTGAAKLVFVANKDGFRTNPANTLIHQALDALEERSVVHIAEMLKSNIVRVPASVRRKADLICHRDASSHPLIVQWRRPEMQQFHDEKRKWLDVRAALVWDFQQSVNELVVAKGGSPQTTTVDVTGGMVIALSGILRLSVNENAEIPSEPSLLESLSRFRDQFLDFLVEHPDGRRRPTR
jgi:hypothetical protein